MSEEVKFLDAFGASLTLRDVIREILLFIEKAPERRYKVVIGTDSEKDAMGTDFVSAVVVHRVGNGGRYWWRGMRGPSYKALRDRIYQEAFFSLKLAQELIEIVRHDRLQNIDLEIHVDIGEVGETRVMLQEVVGIIRGSGFEVRTKPDSYAATKVADRHV
ncbi:MAG: ribonuclease H-like YkuK family protein [Parcubacteria group bacterium]|nr:ribonuclease H-like YkuK family protein [Parcubacteria group bacterium]